jgi:hexosaminidase
VKQFSLAIFLIIFFQLASAGALRATDGFAIKGFHLDLRIQVMTMPALKEFAFQLKQRGLNTLIIEWESTFPFEGHPLIPGKYAYKKQDVISFLKYCTTLGLDVIPLQQSFGHVEYILQHQRYKNIREDDKDYSQVCPIETAGDSLLFSDLYKELAQVHSSPYLHIGGDETYLLGHDKKCQQKVAKEGKSKLYIDYINMLCRIALRLGKRPVLWADIALKYPEAIKSLPKEVVFIDWNYGWELNRFGDHKPLLESGFEIWGAPAIRSYPDNYYISDWQKHFNNIRDFVPMSDSLGYKGIILTSWSTSGLYSSVFESEGNLLSLYAIRHVYPLSGFNMLLDAFVERLKDPASSFTPNEFIVNYGSRQFGFDRSQSIRFWKAFTMTPYDVKQGKVMAPSPMSVEQLLDSAITSRNKLFDLHPRKNQTAYEHFKLMADIREFHLRYEWIEFRVNDPKTIIGESVMHELEDLMRRAPEIDRKFIEVNTGFLNNAELQEENTLRNSRLKNLYERLTRKR